jgi:hypothetical protein
MSSPPLSVSQDLVIPFPIITDVIRFLRHSIPATCVSLEPPCWDGEHRLAQMETLINIIPVLDDDEEQEHMNTLHATVTELREDVHQASG